MRLNSGKPLPQKQAEIEQLVLKLNQQAYQAFAPETWWHVAFVSAQHAVQAQRLLSCSGVATYLPVRWSITKPSRHVKSKRRRLAPALPGTLWVEANSYMCFTQKTKANSNPVYALMQSHGHTARLSGPVLASFVDENSSYFAVDPYRRYLQAC